MLSGTRSHSLMRFIRKLAGVSSRDASDAELVERFVTAQDETAFEALMDRHGAMVWGVCRRVLGNSADADDAYQATFLVLARNAASIRKLNSVGPWLHGVALRIAQKARVGAARRRQREAEAAESRPQQAEDSLTLGEVKQILDEELEALPEKYKAPLVLCCLEGKSREDAAEELGWSVGSLKGRLERARVLLGERLARRGLTLSAGLIAITLFETGPIAAAPAGLTAATAVACTHLAAGQTITGVVSAQVLGLTRFGLGSVVVAKLKPMIAAVVLIAGLGIASYPMASSHQVDDAMDGGVDVATIAQPVKPIVAPAAPPKVEPEVAANVVDLAPRVEEPIVQDPPTKKERPKASPTTPGRTGLASAIRGLSSHIETKVAGKNIISSTQKSGIQITPAKGEGKKFSSPPSGEGQ